MMRRLAPALVLALAATVLVAPAAAAQSGDDRPTAVVSLGDSYISGESGRWEGNSSSDYGDRRGTDRAAYRSRWWWRYDESRVYGDSGANGCHRSDVAPVLSSGIAVDELINLACSGSATRNLIRSANGGEGLKGEPSQADQLAAIADDYDIEMVVVSIGGNDLGFGGIIFSCAIDYLLSTSARPNTCNEEQQEEAEARMPAAMAGVAAALSEIQAVLAEAGHGPDDYRLVLQSYPSPVPRGDDFRYRQSGWTRTFTGGCPFWDADATWARDTFVPWLSAGLATVAAQNGAEFLDLSDALEGREICADGVSQGSGSSAEWARFLTTGVLQGESQESLHPNAIGQQALGTCLGLVWAASPGDHACTNVAGAGPEKMLLTSS